MGAERRLAAAALLAIVSAVTVVAQRPASQTGPRDFRPEASGTAFVRGRVMVDGTTSPVRGAVVRAIPRSAGEVLTTETNGEGWFAFNGLAAGNWTFDVEKGGFLPGHLGQRTATGPGTTLRLAGGESHSVAIPLIRGAVIAGRLLDDTGEPAIAARVQAMRWTTTEGVRTLAPAGEDQTDDTGSFRIHSLPPGEYVVMARGAGTTPTLMRLENRPNPDGMGGVVRMVHSDAAPGAFGSRATAPTYFPGTTSADDAQRLTLRRGEERVGITFATSTAPLVRVSGTVVSSSGAPIDGQVTVSLLDGLGHTGASRPAQASRRPNGDFELRDVAPGSYLLVAAHGSFPAPQSEFATMPLVVGGEDIVGLTVMTRPGGSVRGTVTADGDVKPDTRDMGVYARPLRRGAFPLVDIGAPVRDGRFEIANIAAVSRLQIDRMPPGWALKSIVIEGVDVTDLPIEFTSGSRLNATVVLTNRLTRLGGVATAAGKPAEHATVVVFAEDQARWLFPSRFVAVTRADAAGNYAIAGLPPLEHYLATAVDEYESGMEHDPEFLERLRAGATPLSLGEGESKRLNLAVAER